MLYDDGFVINHHIAGTMSEMNQEELLAQIERFKEKTGLGDDALEKIYNAGDYEFFAGEQGKIDYATQQVPESVFAEMMSSLPPYSESWESNIGLPVDEYRERVKNEILELLTSDESLAQIEKIEDGTGISPEQIARMLTGSGDALENVFEALSMPFIIEDINELKQTGISTDDITQRLEGQLTHGKNLGNFEMVVETIDEMHREFVEGEDLSQPKQLDPERNETFAARIRNAKPDERKR